MNADLYRLPPGAYSVHARSRAGGSGQALIEVYTESPGSSGIFNASLRVWVSRGQSPAIVGLVSSGVRSYLLRGVGATLRDMGVTDAAPALSFAGFGAEGAPLFSSDELAPLHPTAIVDYHTRQSGAFSLRADAQEPSVLTTLPAGVATFHLRPRETAGEVLFELYLVP